MGNSSRRNFLTTAAALAGTAMLPRLADAQSQATANWDLSWLDRLNGKHKQVFDVESIDSPLRTIRNWLDAHRDVLGDQASDLNAIVGIAGKAFPINASDELYKNFPIGEDWKVEDPETKKPTLRNIYLEGGKVPENTVHALQARGVVFWQCNMALKRITKDFADKLKRPEADVYAELKAGLNPGVILIPAHTMLIGLAQEKGCAYEKL
jgi:hypothetical protein